MVRFKDFILVENEKDFDVNKFYADCKPFIQKIRGIRQEHLPKHGSRIPPRSWEIREVVQREKSRDMPIEFHKAIDDYFEKRFGWRARSQSVFTTGDLGQSEEYGTSTLCFPIGRNFQTLWGENVKDLFSWFYSFREKILRKRFEKSIYDYYTYLYNEKTLFKIIPTIIEQTIDEIKKVRWHHNEMLKEGYESGNEVLIDADKVYLIRMFGGRGNVHQVVIDHLKSLRMITD